MKLLLKLLLVLPSLALAQSTDVPMMGTSPAQPAPAQTQAVAPAPARKHVQKRAATPVATQPKGEILPPPSQVTKDFYQAFAQGNLPLADMLIQQGADINCRNCGERTPIMLKLSQGNFDAVSWIIARGADVNLPGPTLYGRMSPLTLLARGNYSTKEIVLTLLQSGADPNGQDIEGNTPFMAWAGRDFAQDYKIEGLAAMLDHGADINHANKMGQTALMHAIADSSNCSLQAVQFLLSRGASASLTTVDGKTAATYAYQQALRGSTQCNQVLAILKAPPQPMADTPLPTSGQIGATHVGGGVQPGQWQGVFNATSPRSASVGTTATISQGGAVAFASQAGMRGTGRLNVSGNQMSGTFMAPSPVDANGRPMFTNPDGSSDIVFRLAGTVTNGVMRGTYVSSIESGTFAMCDSAAYEQTAACKPTQASAGDLLKVLGGLAGVLKGLSNSTR